MKVLLISTNQYTQPHPVYPLGLDYVAGALTEEHSVDIIDLNAEDAIDTLKKTLGRLSPDIVGLSIRNIDNSDVTAPRGFFAKYRQIANTVRTAEKRTKKTIILVLGGSGFTLFPSELMAGLGADYGIVGEGERFALLLKTLTSGNDPALIPGIMVRDKKAPHPSPWQGEISEYFDPERAHLSYYLKHGGILNLQTKRGCRYRCIYCTYPHIEGNQPRLFDPNEVARTARRLEAAGAKYLFITDSTFNAEMEHTLAVAKAFSRARIGIPWGAFFAPMKPTNDYFNILADAGLSHVEFGTESLSNPVLRAYRKPFTREHVENAHQAALDANLNVAHYLLLGGPGETKETITKTLARAGEFTKCALFVFCGMRIYPHTKLFQMAIDEGQIAPVDSLVEPAFYDNRDLPKDDLIRQVNQWAKGNPNRIVGAGGEEVAQVISRLYRRGFSGPLWEYLIR